jgi:hypothetical protein
MATQPIVPPNVPPGMKPVAPPLVPSAPGKAGMPPLPAAAAKGALPPGAKAPAIPAVPGEADPLEHVHPAGFWQQPWVQNILPFVTSLSVHAGILIIGLLIWGVAKVIATPPHQDQTIIPDSQMVDAGPPGGVPNVGLGGDPLRQAMQDKDPTQGSKDGWADKKSPNVDLSAAGGGSGDDAQVIGPGQLSGFGSGKGNGGGHGDGAGGGSGDGGGPMAMFGTPGGGGIGPKGPVFGNGGNAREIVFLCDATGSMLNKMATLKDELNKAVVGLRPIQSFDIIFYQDVKVEQFQKTLVPATPEIKRKAGTYLEGVTSEGTTDPIPALEAALKLKPQLLYFLTDAADFPDTKAVTDTIAKYNKDNKIKINTILFVEDKTEHEKNLDSEGLMKGIAEKSGGRFRWVEMDAIQQ